MIELEKKVLFLDGKRYEIIPSENPINISEYNETNFPTEITHRVKGFEEDIHLIIEKTGRNEMFFSFGYFLGDTGLFISVEDEKIIETANKLVFMALGEED